MPPSQIMGSVGCPGAWGKRMGDGAAAAAGRPGHGAVFFNDTALAKDTVVGCILHGQFQVRLFPRLEMCINLVWSVVVVGSRNHLRLVPMV